MRLNELIRAEYVYGTINIEKIFKLGDFGHIQSILKETFLFIYFILKSTIKINEE